MAAKETEDALPEKLYSLKHDELPEKIAERAFTSGDYPYEDKLKSKHYKKDLQALQIELVKLQDWIRRTGERVVVLFEGRDAAGKGGTIKRFTEHLNPRHAHVVALAKPTETERGQWYFQRYAARLPTAGDIALFDRSWYNRAGVERVMGFCSKEELEAFYNQVNEYEDLLVRDGVHLFKVWLTIGREEQIDRFYKRKLDPLKRWKLSDIDLMAVDRWHDYTEAKREMFQRTHTPIAPWTVIKANDKRRTRLNAIRVVLSAFPYAQKDADAIGLIDPKIVGTGVDEME
mgnify:CR=1 FL=1